MVSYKIKGLEIPIKRKKILNQLKALHCSIAMLQEGGREGGIGWNKYTAHLMKKEGKEGLLFYLERVFF